MPEKKYTPALQVTPNDGADLAFTATKLFIGVSGSLKATLADGSVVTIASVPTGIFHHQVVRVWSTGTSASGIVGLCSDAVHRLPDGSIVSTLV